MRKIEAVIQEAQDIASLKGNREWCFLRSQPVTEYEWVAIFERGQDELGIVPTPPDECPPSWHTDKITMLDKVGTPIAVCCENMLKT